MEKINKTIDNIYKFYEKKTGKNAKDTTDYEIKKEFFLKLENDISIYIFQYMKNFTRLEKYKYFFNKNDIIKIVNYYFNVINSNILCLQNEKVVNKLINELLLKGDELPKKTDLSFDLAELIATACIIKIFKIKI